MQFRFFTNINNCYNVRSQLILRTLIQHDRYFYLNYYKIFYSFVYDKQLKRKNKEFFIYINPIDNRLYSIKKSIINSNIHISEFIFFVPLNNLLILCFNNSINSELKISLIDNQDVTLISPRPNILYECLKIFPNSFISYYNELIPKIKAQFLLKKI